MVRFSRLIKSAGQQWSKAIEYQTRMTELPVPGPENGGTGKMPKALYLGGLLRELGITDILCTDTPDPRVPGDVRPNVVARIPGASPRRLWVLGHMDAVPPGELSYWGTNPWKVVVDGDKIRGHGVEDNQQAIVCGLLIAQGLKAQDIIPDLSLGLILVSDEETSNRYGIHYILETRAGLFGPDNFVVVPDYGMTDGSSVEISGKGQLWMHAKVLGHQCHVSRPQEDRNSLVAATDTVLHVRDLESTCAQVGPLFQPLCCTFIPTRHEESAPNINSLPGKDVFHIDYRILPDISHDDVLASAQEIMEAIAERHSVTVDITTVANAPASPATPSNSEVVLRLSVGIREVYGIEPHCAGSGSETMAMGFRSMNIPATVQASAVPAHHLANKYSLISRTIGDTQVLTQMLLGQGVMKIGEEEPF